MKIFAGLKFQRRKPSAAPSVAAPRVRDERLTVHGGGNGEEARSHGGDAGAETVHVVENAEGGGDADNPDDGEAPIEDEAGDAGNELRKELRADAGRDQENRGDGHADEEFHLVMEQAAVVEEADDGEQRSSGEDAEDLLLGTSWRVSRIASTKPR